MGFIKLLFLYNDIKNINFKFPKLGSLFFTFAISFVILNSSVALSADAAASGATATSSSSGSAAGAASLGGATEDASIALSVGQVEFTKAAKCTFFYPITQTKIGALCTSALTTSNICSPSFDTAQMACRVETNSTLLGTIGEVQGVLTMGQGAGIGNSCSSFSKAMNIAKKGMALYSAACATVQTACTASCTSALATLTKLNAAIPVVMTELQDEIVSQKTLKAGHLINANLARTSTPPNLALATSEENAAVLNEQNIGQMTEDIALLKVLQPLVTKEVTDTKTVSIAAKDSKCKFEMKQLLISAATNLVSFVQADAQGKQCEAQAEAEKASCNNPDNKNKPECLPKSNYVDCSKSENASTPTCICKANPRQQGCEGVSTALATNSTNLGSSSAGSIAGNTKGNPGLGSNNKPSDGIDSLKRDASSGNGLGGAKGGAGIDGGSGGGGSGAVAGSGGSGGEQKSTSGKSGSTLDANILGGSDGGGSGGGFRFSGSSGFDKSRLKSFAQNQGIKPRNIAGEGWTAQVTNDGKTNFNKVKVRYNDNRPTLLTEGK